MTSIDPSRSLPRLPTRTLEARPLRRTTDTGKTLGKGAEGIGAAARKVLESGFSPATGVGQVVAGAGLSRSHLFHDLGVAAKLKRTLQLQFAFAPRGKPLPADQSPRPGPDGRLVAPNGDPLIRVRISGDRGVVGAGEYALVDPKTNEVYREVDSGGFINHRSYYGPTRLPEGCRFEGKHFSASELNLLERVANGSRFHPVPTKPGVLDQLETRAASLDYDGQAPDPANVASTRVLKSEHPFTYYVVTLKDDPTHVLVKKVLTGGFVPAGPNDGAWSQPIPV